MKPTFLFALLVSALLGIAIGVVGARAFTRAQHAPEHARPDPREILSVARSQIELYRVRNSGDLPPTGALWATLVQDGYLPQPLENPFNGSTSVVPGASPMDAGRSDGWVLDADSGVLYLARFDERSGSFAP